MATTLHPTALVDPAAELDDGVEIGAFSIVGPHVRIGAGTRVGPHVVLSGHTRIGRDNEIFQFCSIGAAPQDKKYAGEPTELVIGDRNTIRECCTFNTGTVQDTGITRFGSDNWVMAYVHVAHDCVVGDHVILANSTNLAGHVHIGDWAILGGFTGVHQFVRVGAHAFCGVHSSVLQDVPPYVMASGVPLAPHGINSEGLKRRGFSPEAVMAIKRAYKTLYKSGLRLEEAREQIEQAALAQPELQLLASFLADSGRGITR